jgi:hypothetical protein
MQLLLFVAIALHFKKHTIVATVIFALKAH